MKKRFIEVSSSVCRQLILRLIWSRRTDQFKRLLSLASILIPALVATYSCCCPVLLSIKCDEYKAEAIKKVEFNVEKYKVT